MGGSGVVDRGLNEMYRRDWDMGVEGKGVMNKDLMNKILAEALGPDGPCTLQVRYLSECMLPHLQTMAAPTTCAYPSVRHGTLSWWIMTPGAQPRENHGFVLRGIYHLLNAGGSLPVLPSHKI